MSIYFDNGKAMPYCLFIAQTESPDRGENETNMNFDDQDLVNLELKWNEMPDDPRSWVIMDLIHDLRRAREEAKRLKDAAKE